MPDESPFVLPQNCDVFQPIPEFVSTPAVDGNESLGAFREALSAAPELEATPASRTHRKDRSMKTSAKSVTAIMLSGLLAASRVCSSAFDSHFS